MLSADLCDTFTFSSSSSIILFEMILLKYQISEVNRLMTESVKSSDLVRSSTWLSKISPSYCYNYELKILLSPKHASKPYSIWSILSGLPTFMNLTYLNVTLTVKVQRWKLICRRFISSSPRRCHAYATTRCQRSFWTNCYGTQLHDWPLGITEVERLNDSTITDCTITQFIR